MNTRFLVVIVVLLLGGFGFFAWQQSSKRTQAAEPHGSSGDPMGMLTPPTSKDPGLRWDVPSRWQSEPAQGMRLATYVVPGPDGTGSAQCVVYYFGPGQGGGVEENMARWSGEFENAGSPERSNEAIHGVTVSRIKVKGDYLGHAMMGSAPEGDGKNWMLLGAIAEGPNGSLFYKFTGPQVTVAGAEKEFDQMLASLQEE